MFFIAQDRRRENANTSPKVLKSPERKYETAVFQLTGDHIRFFEAVPDFV
jgi:hypothetical protein